ncbi:co-regulatory protein PtrA N-terminal domain-containing protein [Pseudomonas putida]|uniref:Uncharacterized protein n=1 Tax=Pseudomonas putida TaxID=303 RepID=A0A1Q9R042_PSEPU|nr:co-regulatory protein PtrA N-terminal domain-containing protein [Pseudomonas putida]OLS60780.1 hypothetical protein PSEMO_43720 [Pseudomonas putida]
MSMFKAATLSVLFALPVLAHAEGGSDRVNEWHAQFQQAQKEAPQQAVADKKAEQSTADKRDS